MKGITGLMFCKEIISITGKYLLGLASRHPEQVPLRLRDLGPQRVPERCAAAGGDDELVGASRSRESTDPPPQVVRQAAERGRGDAFVAEA